MSARFVRSKLWRVKCEVLEGSGAGTVRVSKVLIVPAESLEAASELTHTAIPNAKLTEVWEALGEGLVVAD